MDNEVRVRFAPSPTGYLHVGGARTALYNWLFARNQGGKFLLRIENTDVKRSSKEMEEYIKEAMLWLGLDWDEDIVYQLDRLEIYRKFAQELIEKGLAYYCYTPPEELKKEGGGVECFEVDTAEYQGKPLAIKFRVPDEGTTEFYDIIRGHISFKNKDISDFVIVRSDGIPTYNFAVVVDDHYMGITHVIRGEDHISNTPKQIMIYKAFGWKIPEFAHLPMILGPDKKRLSKRHGATSVLEYREQGILPEALFNFLALLGWSPGDNREIVPKDEMIKLFDLTRVGKRAAVFDLDKLHWINSEYIRMKSDEEIYKLALPFVERAGLVKNDEDREKFRKVVPLLKERARLLKDFVDLSEYFFKDVKSYDEKGVKKHFKEGVEERLSLLVERLEKLDSFDEKSIENVVRALAEELGVSAAKIIHPTRLAVTGRTFGPGLFELMTVLGKDECIKRLKKAITWLEDRKSNQMD